jgi:dTDP-4-amino-4,6-dideoxygalactose transaminase
MLIPHSRPSIDESEISAVSKVLRSQYLAEGLKVGEFQDRLSSYIGRRYALAVNSGTAALHLALLALKVKWQDEVIIPSFVCTAVLNAVKQTGARPRIADINEGDFNISLDSTKKLISRRTKAVIVPHMFGTAADIDGFLKLGIPIIEDCALSIGATYKGKKVGGFGKLSVFSFYATKVITTAEGGAVLTNESKLYAFILDLRNYDNRQNYNLRYNYKMSDLSSAMGIAQLKKLPKFIRRRQNIARQYNFGLSGLGLQLPIAEANKSHIYYRYIIRGKNKANRLISRLRRFGIEAKRPIFKPLHSYLGLKDKDFPVASSVYNTALSLPIYPGLQDAKVKFIIDKVRLVI